MAPKIPAVLAVEAWLGKWMENTMALWQGIWPVICLLKLDASRSNATSSPTPTIYICQSKRIRHLDQTSALFPLWMLNNPRSMDFPTHWHYTLSRDPHHRDMKSLRPWWQGIDGFRLDKNWTKTNGDLWNFKFPWEKNRTLIYTPTTPHKHWSQMGPHAGS